jgi:hypothetical protein
MNIHNLSENILPEHSHENLLFFDEVLEDEVLLLNEECMFLKQFSIFLVKIFLERKLLSNELEMQVSLLLEF